MDEWITVQELASMLEKPYSTVKSSVRRGKYNFKTRISGKAGGNSGKVWLININDPAIPEDVRQAYLNSQSSKISQINAISLPNSADHPFPAELGCGTSSLLGRRVDHNPPASLTLLKTDRGAADIAIPPGDAVLQAKRAESSSPVSATPDMVPGKFKIIALTRLDLVKALLENRKLCASPGTYGRADRDFEKAYNNGFLSPHIFQILGKVDIHTIYRWNRKLCGTSDWTLLVPDWNIERKEPSLTHEEKLIFQDSLLNPNRLSIGEATRITKVVLAHREIPSPSAPVTFRRWAEWFKGKNSPLWTLMRDGEKAIKDKEIFSIRRDTSKLEVGDVLVADGHRLNSQVINPYTGKPCRATLIGYLDWKSFSLAGFEIMVEENTQGIASALRNSIIRLGKIPKVAYQDNGKSFRARFFTESVDFEESGLRGLFGKLGIEPVFAKPYNAKAKPVERFFKEFGKFERLLPSFTGASVNDKPAWTRMGETFHKIHHNDYVPTIQETIEMVETWIREYLEVQPCPHVKGKTIGEVFNEGRGPGVNINDLDDLMMATEIKTIRANGIRFLGADYYDDALFGLRESVFIKYSLSDLSSIKVYDREGRPLCSAKRTMAVHPMAAQLGSAKDVAEVRHLQNKQRSLQKSVLKAAKAYISNKQDLPPWADIVPMTPRTIEALEDMKSALSEPEEVCIPDYMLKSFLPAIPATIQPETETFSDGKLVRPDFGMEFSLRYEWHLKHGYTGPEDEEYCQWFKTTNYYRDNFAFFDEQNNRLQAEEAERVVQGSTKNCPVTAPPIHGATIQ